MKQVLQDARTGEVEVADVPAPKLLPGCVLVRMAASLVSAGTERAAAEFAGKNLLQKARARPDLVRDVLNKVRRDGLFSAVSAVRGRLDQPVALGYSSAGTVIGVGEGVSDVNVGDRVACAGAGHAVHAEFACVPRLLVARIPSQSVSFEEAAFTTVAAVALHGIRTAEVKLGDRVAVIGLGLLGQLTVQLLKAAGCLVLGMDIVAQRSELARRLGADGVSSTASDFRDLCFQHSGGQGVDVVLITAETPSSDPVNLAGAIARDRGLVVAVGTVGIEIQRKSYYEKELDFRISRSYGPGRYDAAYEQKGRDYPIGYVRWTETRNMEAFLQLLAEGKVDLRPLITHRFPVERAQGAYQLISGQQDEASLGVLITYAEDADPNQQVRLASRKAVALAREQAVTVGLLGAGAFATSTLLPAMKQAAGVKLVAVCTAGGVHARHAAGKFGFQSSGTDEARILGDTAINTIVIATRHHLHAPQVLAALASGKHVFCEKPLCLREGELADIVRAYTNSSHGRKLALMVGFNRRFAPMAVRMKEFMKDVHEPLALHYRVNAGYLPPDHWVNDPEQGGGRIIGEMCHFVDFLAFLAGSLPIEVQTRSLANPAQYSGDNLVLSLAFADGSQGTVTYVANGAKSYSKERVEVFGGGRVAVLEDFRRLELVRDDRKQIVRSRFRQDKGHDAEWQAFAQAIQKGTGNPIPFEEIVAITLATFRAVDSQSSGQPAGIDTHSFIRANSSVRHSDS
jgi:predicted dehydrogenase/threonine dehydrogenase-like Zn-dependent dehydrogenase